MKQRLRVPLLLFLIFLLLPGFAMAVPVNVDGDLSEWGLTSATGLNDPETVGIPVVGSSGGIQFWEEYGWTGSSGYVEPGYGGQLYDIAGIYYTFDASASSHYIAAIVGAPPGEISQGLYLGDLFFNDGQYAVITNARDSFGIGDFGEVLTASAVAYSAHSSSNPDQVLTFNGATSSLSDFYYGISSFDNSWYVLELAIPTALLANISDIHLTQTCGNDSGTLSVPEPSNMFLIGTGLLGLVAVGRKRYFK